MHVWTSGTTAYSKITPTATGSNPFGQMVPSSASALVRSDPWRSAPLKFVLKRFVLVRSALLHDPPPDVRRRCGYPLPIVEHHEAVAIFWA